MLCLGMARTYYCLSICDEFLRVNALATPAYLCGNFLEGSIQRSTSLTTPHVMNDDQYCRKRWHTSKKYRVGTLVAWSLARANFWPILVDKNQGLSCKSVWVSRVSCPVGHSKRIHVMNFPESMLQELMCTFVEFLGRFKEVAIDIVNRPLWQGLS